MTPEERAIILAYLKSQVELLSVDPQPVPQPEPEPIPTPEPTPEPEPTPAPLPVLGSWTTLIPSADTRKVYVSHSIGLNTNDGLSESTPKKTIAAGIALLRTGFPDWLLLKAGDTWTNQSLGSWSKSGRSLTEPMVVTSYGSGARPRILTGTNSALMVFNSTPKSFLSFVGLHLEPHTYTGTQGTTGILWLAPADGILFEDCFVTGYKDNFVIQKDSGSINDFKIRRCVIVDAWSATSSHSQGVYALGVNGLLIEESVFDHNGWKESVGPATVYNHNTYLEDCSDTILRRNLFLRSSSIGNKFTSSTAGASKNCVVEDNFYLEGEVGISAGGNSSSALRFVNMSIKDNVMMNIGRTHPTNRDLAWYLEVKDWDGGVIDGNLFLHQTLQDNCFGIRFGGGSERNILVKHNIFFNLRGSDLLQGETGRTGFVFENNDFQNSNLSSYANPYRDELSYAHWVSGDSLIVESRFQSKSFWRPAYTAPFINGYIRQGYGR